MLAVHRVVGEDVVVEIVAPQQQPGDADAGEDQHAEGEAGAQHVRRQHAAQIVEAEDEPVEDEPGAEDHAGLEPAARPVIAVELHVEREDQDERHQQLGDDAEDQEVPHASSSAASVSRRWARQRPSSSTTPMPAVKITVTSPSVS